MVVGPIRRAILTYGPDGRSRGVATIEFTNPERAATAALHYNGVQVDNRPIKVISVHPVTYGSVTDELFAGRDRCGT